MTNLKKARKIFANSGGRGEGSIKFGNFSKIYEQACNSEAHIIFATMRKRVELKLRNFVNGTSRVLEEAALHREPGWQFSFSDSFGGLTHIFTRFTAYGLCYIRNIYFVSNVSQMSETGSFSHLFNLVLA